MTGIILASGSAVRARLLEGAGVPFTIMKPGVDEEEIKRTGQVKNQDLTDTALALAEAKALAVEASPKCLVIGSDQILEFRGEPYDKPRTMEEARARLRGLQGQTHRLINAVVVARNRKIIWRHVDRPNLTMREMSDCDIDAYLNTAGDQILASVGAYQVEGLGARLFVTIDGDYFAVLGLSLFPLLQFLRAEGAVEF